jgi:hypothetical protein
MIPDCLQVVNLQGFGRFKAQLLSAADCPLPNTSVRGWTFTCHFSRLSQPRSAGPRRLFSVPCLPIPYAVLPGRFPLIARLQAHVAELRVRAFRSLQSDGEFFARSATNPRL